MAIYDFSNLESKFSEIVQIMPDPFDSHQFLLEIAQQNQAEYITALNAYLESGNNAPFQAVHKAIIQKLVSHIELVTKIRDDKPSIDIFGHSNQCAEWKKVTTG